MISNRLFKYIFRFVSNTIRLLRIWRAEVEKKGMAKASFDRVWRKFIQTRVFVALLVQTLNALAFFLSSASRLFIMIASILFSQTTCIMFDIYHYIRLLAHLSRRLSG